MPSISIYHNKSETKFDPLHDTIKAPPSHICMKETQRVAERRGVSLRVVVVLSRERPDLRSTLHEPGKRESIFSLGD